MLGIQHNYSSNEILEVSILQSRGLRKIKLPQNAPN